MAKNLKELLLSRPKESQVRISKLANKLSFKVELSQIREKVGLSQQELANVLEIKQPSLSAIENRGDELKLSTLKKYIAGLGGELHINVELPCGEKIKFY